MSGLEPGWYTADDGQQKYWDGSQWLQRSGPQTGQGPEQVPAESADSSPSQEENNGLAVAALVLGVGSFLVWFVSIPGIVVGHLARNKAKRLGGTGSGIALAGLICSYIVTVAVAAIFFLAFVVIPVFLQQREQADEAGIEEAAGQAVANANKSFEQLPPDTQQRLCREYAADGDGTVDQLAANPAFDAFADTVEASQTRQVFHDVLEFQCQYFLPGPWVSPAPTSQTTTSPTPAQPLAPNYGAMEAAKELHDWVGIFAGTDGLLCLSKVRGPEWSTCGVMEDHFVLMEQKLASWQRGIADRAFPVDGPSEWYPSRETVNTFNAEAANLVESVRNEQVVDAALFNAAYRRLEKEWPPPGPDTPEAPGVTRDPFDYP